LYGLRTRFVDELETPANGGLSRVVKRMRYPPARGTGPHESVTPQQTSGGLGFINPRRRSEISTQPGLAQSMGRLLGARGIPATPMGREWACPLLPIGAPTDAPACSVLWLASKLRRRGFTWCSFPKPITVATCTARPTPRPKRPSSTGASAPVPSLLRAVLLFGLIKSSRAQNRRDRRGQDGAVLKPLR
jgi:hypothetical protein